jgi:hypothetical protein
LSNDDGLPLFKEVSVKSTHAPDRGGANGAATPVMFIRLDFANGKTYAVEIPDDMMQAIAEHGVPVSQSLDICSRATWERIKLCGSP